MTDPLAPGVGCTHPHPPPAQTIRTHAQQLRRGEAAATDGAVHETRREQVAGLDNTCDLSLPVVSGTLASVERTQAVKKHDSAIKAGFRATKPRGRGRPRATASHNRAGPRAINLRGRRRPDATAPRRQKRALRPRARRARARRRARKTASTRKRGSPGTDSGRCPPETALVLLAVALSPSSRREAAAPSSAMRRAPLASDS